MKILVTGAAGFIGSHLVDALLAKGLYVIGVDNFSNGIRSNLDRAFTNPNFNFLPIDIREKETVEKLFKENEIGAVFHIAARGSVPASISDPTATFENNVVASHELMILAARYNVQKFIYASSSSVYGDQDVPLKAEYLKPNPLNPYGISKLMVEMYAANFHKFFRLNTVGLRFFNVYGPRQRADSDYSAVIPKFFGSRLGGDILKIYGDGEAYRDFTFVGDVCQTMIRVFESQDSDIGGDVFNVCTGRATRIADLAAAILQMTPGPKNAYAYQARRQGDVEQSLGDNSKLARKFDYWPQTPLEVGLEKTYQFFKGKGGAL